ncbi:alpha/beta fold hydrolase [Henriciella marina]|uniref:alpha/beta fold hydrolase n=1 Tax=Henriciella marina TaxID=453851 RepID=UPI00037D26D0|nr:alpha/beta hydrolase [Henriciella marina]
MPPINRRDLMSSAVASMLLAGCRDDLLGIARATLQPRHSNLREPEMIPYADFSAVRKLADTPFGKIAYVEMGSGRPALFLHGLGLNAYYWTGQLTGLSGDRRCIALDLMAHGETEISAEQDVTFTAQAEMVLAFLDTLGLESIDLIGSDSGGAIAQIVAVKAPNRINSLVLTNCDVHDNWPPAALEALRASAPAGGLAESFAAITGTPGLMRAEQGLAQMVFENPQAVTDDLTRIFLTPLTRTPERRAAFNKYVAPQDTAQLTRIEPDLRRLQVPCLILWATDDIFFGLDWAYWLQDALLNARPVIEFDGAKLFFPFERPARVNAEIQSFWTSL